MNEVLERMELFRAALGHFVEVVGQGSRQRAASAQALAPYWDDDFGRQFEKLTREVEDPILEFRRLVDRELLPFIDGKIHQVRRYLDG